MKSDKIIDAIGNINESMISAADADISADTASANGFASGTRRTAGERRGRKTGAIAGIIAAVVAVAGISAGIILGYRANRGHDNPAIISATDDVHGTQTPAATSVSAPTAIPVITGDAAIAPLKTLWYEIDNTGLTVPMTYKEFLSGLGKMDDEGRPLLKLLGDPAEIPDDQSGKYELESVGFTGRFYRIFSPDGSELERNVVQYMLFKNINGAPEPLGIKIGDSIETVLTKLGIGELAENVWERGKRTFAAEVDGTRLEADLICEKHRDFEDLGLAVTLLIRMEEALGDGRYHAKNMSFAFVEEPNVLLSWTVMVVLDKDEYRSLPLNIPTPAPATATPGPTEVLKDNTFSIGFVDNKLHITDPTYEVSVYLAGTRANNNEDNKLIAFFKDALEGKALDDTYPFNVIKYTVSQGHYNYRLVPYGSDSGYDLYFQYGSTTQEMWIINSADNTCVGSIAFTDEEYITLYYAISDAAFKVNGDMLLKDGDPVKIRITDRKYNEKWLYSSGEIERMKQLISNLRITSMTEIDPSDGIFSWEYALRFYYADGSVSEFKTNGYTLWTVDNKTLCQDSSDASLFEFFDSFADETGIQPDVDIPVNESPFVIARTGDTFRFERIDTVPKVVLNATAYNSGKTLDNTNGRITEFVRELLEGKQINILNQTRPQMTYCEFWLDFIPEDGSSLYGYRLAYNFKYRTLRVTDLTEDNTFANVPITDEELGELVAFLFGSTALDLPDASGIRRIDITATFLNKEVNSVTLTDQDGIGSLMSMFSSLKPIVSETGKSSIDAYEIYYYDIWCTDNTLWKVKTYGSVIEISKGQETKNYYIFLCDYEAFYPALELIIPVN
ncbi:MAG: hypothetical protein J5950_03325 [Clostridia bacterium]|nr:hypothetical protein [Clostridia bacterium]